jgi:hypothetical protein
MSIRICLFIPFGIDNKVNNQSEGLRGISEGFEMPGSVAQYPPSLSFKVDYMSLIVSPYCQPRYKEDRIRYR